MGAQFAVKYGRYCHMATPLAIEEEQIALLHKLRLQCEGTLGGRERQVLDSLEENLEARLKRRHRIEAKAERLYIKPSPLGGGDQLTDVDQQQYKAKLHILRGLLPHEVVKRFVESWNSAEFETEYICLSTNFAKGGPKDETMSQYLEKRKARYRQRVGSLCIKKNVRDSRLVRSTGHEAVVECTEVHDGSDGPKTFRREYKLVFEEGAWRVLDFHNLSETPPAPPSALTRQADRGAENRL
jgi:hypothetical protein